MPDDAIIATDQAREWLRRWDRQQEGYVEHRLARSRMMAEAIRRFCGDDPVILDLGCGPGSLGRDLLDDIPGARVVGVDMDPVLMTLGRAALADLADRITWIDADIAAPEWVERLPERSFDAVVSATALHWLHPGELVEVLHAVLGLLNPGGVFLNADHLDYPESAPRMRAQAFAQVEDWRQAHLQESSEAWYAALSEAYPGMPFEERERRLSTKVRQHRDTGHALHRGALLDAGFAEVDTVWQYWHNRVIVGLKLSKA